MVGRELHTIRPSGEDHQGLVQGGRSESGREKRRSGRRLNVSKSWTAMTAMITMDKKSAWMGDFTVMHYVSLEPILVHIYGGDEVTMIRTTVLNLQMKTQSNKMKVAAERCNSTREIRKKCWYKRRWNVYAAHK